jgi:LPXTG-site transpeptidase (sortase) family protein
MTESISRRALLRSALLIPAGLLLPAHLLAQDSTPTPLIRGPKPVAIFVPDAEIDAPIEVSKITNGQMGEPTGPFVVGWYRESGRLGEANNIVMSGHLDYWGVGRAVFYHLGALGKGDKIRVLGDNDAEFHYEVEWKKKIKAAEASNGGIQDIVGKTDEERLTLITCGGDYDRKTQEYEERTVVRAKPQV